MAAAESGTAGRALPIATLVAALWLAGAGWALLAGAQLPLTPPQWVQLLALLLAPVAAIFALAAAIGARGTAAFAASITPEGAAEADVAGTLVRLQAMRDGLAQDGAALASHGATLEVQIAAARDLAASLGAAAATASGAADDLRTTLATAHDDIASLHHSLLGQQQDLRLEAARTGDAASTLAEGLARFAAEGDTATSTMLSALDRLGAAASDGRVRSEEGMKAIRTETGQLFELLENGINARRETLRQQGKSLSAQMHDGWKQFETMAAAASSRLEQHLGALARQAQTIEERLHAQQTATDELARTGERSFQLLDAKLQHSGQSTHNALDRLSSHVQQVNTDLAGLTAPLKETQTASEALTAAVAGLRESTLQTVDILGQTLPEKTVEASRASETLQTELHALTAAIDTAHDRAVALSQPLAEGRAAIDAASDHFTAQRDAIATGGEALVVELNQARNLMAEVEEQTRDTSLAAATRLVDAMTRVREVATQATGTMRDMLDGLIAESRDSLSRAADDAMRASFAIPVADKAREAEAAAAAAAERTAQSMAVLAQTLKLLEDRTNARLATLEEDRQQEIWAAAALLRERLNSAGLTLAAALDKPMSDDDWAIWRKGERGMFNRRTLSLLDRRDRRDLHAALAANPELKAAAQRYAAEFAALADRLPTLANMLQSSEPGRIAAALGEALED